MERRRSCRRLRSTVKRFRPCDEPSSRSGSAACSSWAVTCWIESSRTTAPCGSTTLLPSFATASPFRRAARSGFAPGSTRTWRADAAVVGVPGAPGRRVRLHAVVDRGRPDHVDLPGAPRRRRRGLHRFHPGRLVGSDMAPSGVPGPLAHRGCPGPARLRSRTRLPARGRVQGDDDRVARGARNPATTPARTTDR